VLGTALAIASFLATAPPITAPKSVSLRYDVYVGDTTHPAVAGLVWLLRYSWYGLQQQRIGLIRDGSATIAFQSDIMPNLERPNKSADDHYVAAFELSGAQWYLSRPIDPNHFFSDLPAAIETIGSTLDGGPGAPRSIGLAQSDMRIITLLNEDGTSVRSYSVGVAVHISNQNHCGMEEGPSLGNRVTDSGGTFFVQSPPIPLTLDLEYFTTRGGQYYLRRGLVVGTARDMVIRRTWNLPYRAVKLKVVEAAGTPVRGLEVEAQYRAENCGAVLSRPGTTDINGVASLSIQQLAIEEIWMKLPSGARRTLTALEQHLLFSRGSLTIRI
jgi:hypothetical protein